LKERSERVRLAAIRLVACTRATAMPRLGCKNLKR
jgi:hypothetical protein